MSRFIGKKVLVTGGNSGIGYASAKEFIREGAEVLLTGRDQKTLDQAKAELGAKAHVLRNDASDLKQIPALIDEVRARLGTLDAVFVNAGVGKFAPLAEITEELFDSTFATNFKGPYFLIQKLVPLLNRGASIVLNGSINAQIGMPGASVYAASKAALISLARNFSAELVDAGIRVNVLSPGPVTTPIFGRLGLPAEQLQAMAKQIESQVPLKRFGEPLEIARAVLFLASSDSTFFLGTELIADGGMSQL